MDQIMIKNQMIRDNKKKFAGFFILSVIFIILTVLESILIIEGFNAFREQLRSINFHMFSYGSFYWHFFH
ncbi:MAG: hypothetical protein ACW964_06905 [Candidatus Hodarchaeales archaeon]|jgi:hypothetical protein